MKKHSNCRLVIIVLLTYCMYLFADVKTCTVNGVVLDQSTRTPVANANVVVLNTEHGAATDMEGRFIIIGLKPAVYNLKASALGYLADIKSEVLLKPGRSTELEFLIEPTVIEGEEAVVVAGFFRQQPDLVTSTRSLSYEEVRRAPGSAEDVQRAIQALPGIA
ncbi:MAG: carboxypeptidase-like regulatory domain-containing protein, partial [Calditrichaeota bacterium]|nr:carboxypeptidase-like regulatory domain-containing protein [Calditrichota bacterium]